MPAAAKRTVAYVCVIAVLWTLMLQAAVTYHTNAVDDKISRIKNEMDALGTDAQLSDGLRHYWEVVRKQVASEIARLEAEEGSALKQLAAAVDLEVARQSEKDADIGAAVAAKSDQELIDQVLIGKGGDDLDASALRDVDGIIDRARYDAQSNFAQAPAADAHRELLKYGTPIVAAIEAQCAIENWRDFLAPLIQAMEGRRDRMLYNYI
jgi:hypothetical protein